MTGPNPGVGALRAVAPDRDPLDAEDVKLVVLARGARARASAVEGAAVRDVDGRTYAAATVTLASFRLSALQAAVAAAVSSGVRALEAAVVVTAGADAGSEFATEDLAALTELRAASAVLADPDGVPRRRYTWSA